MKPLFSVIIPTLGKVDQWSWAVSSVLNQTLNNFEIVAIDSGPEEKSRPILIKYNDQRIVYVNTSSGDPRLNWDIGFRKSSGEYIIWLDDDNYLLPNALETLFKTINETRADIVTGEHMHYRGPKHAIASMRNQLIIPKPPFSRKTYQIEPRDIVRKLLGWAPKHPEVRARFHTSENAVKRSVVEYLISKIGEINFATTSTNALRLGILAIAKTVYAVDHPIALIGQSGEAMTDTWPKIKSPVLQKIVYNFKLSPVKAITYNNYRLEQHLRIKDALKDEMKNFDQNMHKFFESHIQELIFLEQSWLGVLRSWIEARQVLKNHQDPEIRKLYDRTGKYMLYGLIVKTLKTLGLYKFVKSFFKQYRISQKPQTIIPLDEYDVSNIKECAEKLPEIIEKELKIPYKNFI